LVAVVVEMGVWWLLPLVVACILALIFVVRSEQLAALAMRHAVAGRLRLNRISGTLSKA
jgi:hypothetical protein